MIDVPFSLEEATALATLITVVRGPQTVRFTSAQADVTIDGVTWTAAPGVQIAQIQRRTDGDVSNLEVQVGAYSGGSLIPGQIAQGLFDGCTALIEFCDPTDPSGGKATILSGYVGNVSDNRSDQNAFEIRGPVTRARSIFSEQYGPMCRADLGDVRCKVPILPNGVTFLDLDRGLNFTAGQFTRVAIGSAGNPSDYQNVYFEAENDGTTDPSTQPVYDPTIGYETVDGSITFIARDAFVRYAQVSSIIDAHTFALTALPDTRAIDGWYTLGDAIIRGGLFDGTAIPILGWVQSGNVVTAFVEIDAILNPGDWLEMRPGCDKTVATCLAKFDDVVNFRGEPFAPGADATTATVPPVAAVAAAVPSVVAPPAANTSGIETEVINGVTLYKGPGTHESWVVLR